MFFNIAKEKKEKLSDLKYELKWLISISGCYKKEIFIITLISIIKTIFSLTISIFLKRAIDIVTGVSTENVLSVAIFAGLLMLSNIGFSAISSRISTKISIKIQNELQLNVYKSIFSAQWESLRDYRKGDLIDRINSDVNSVSSGVLSWWPNILTILTQFIYAFILIVSNDVIMALIALMTAPISAFSSRLMIRKMHTHNLKIKELNADMMSYQDDSFHNLQYIKSFGISHIINQKLSEKQNKYKEENLNYNKVTITMNIVMGILSLIITFVSYAWGIFRLWEGYITYGTMVMFLQLAFTLTNSFNSLLKVVPTTINLGTSASRIIAIETLPKENVIPTEKENLFIEKSYKTGVDIYCENVTFNYSDEPNVNIIENSTCTIRKGETIAIIGDSGIGKTTFFRLVLGLLNCVDGSISLENIDGDRIKVGASTRKLFAYVPQGNTIIGGTIAENLRLIKQDATDKEIIDALKMSCAYDFVSKLPNGINSYIGESGKGFSEGQIQRISIARALIKDAPVLLFDEVTSALDEETELKLLENIKTNLKTKTIIFVTHRLNALQISDKIFKVENKRFKLVNYRIKEEN